MICAASGTSAVTTRSPGTARLMISLSATSKPEVTCSTRRLGSRGMARGWLATSVTVTPVRSAARKRISLMTFGQASASTQMLAFAMLVFISQFGYETTIYGAARLRFTITLEANWHQTSFDPKLAEPRFWARRCRPTSLSSTTDLRRILYCQVEVGPAEQWGPQDRGRRRDCRRTHNRRRHR